MAKINAFGVATDASEQEPERVEASEPEPAPEPEEPDDSDKVVPIKRGSSRK